MQFDRGYLSPYFVTNPDKMTRAGRRLHPAAREETVSLQPMLPMLEAVVQSGKPLLIIAEDVEGEALATLVVNKLRGGLKIAAVKAPASAIAARPCCEDIAILTGGQVISEDLGIKLENVTMDMLGTAKNVSDHQRRNHDRRWRRQEAEIEGRCTRSAPDRRDHSDYDREKLQERLAKLAGGVAVIRVGGAPKSK